MVPVSIIIPTHRRPESLRKAIESILGQTFPDFELIVVDDCSGDNTSEVVKTFTDPRICFVQHDENRGGAAARNTGIRKAQGSFIAFLDDDDEWLPEKLKLQVDLLDKSPAEVGVVYTGYYEVVEDSEEFISQKTATKTGNLFNALRYKNWVGTTSSVLLKRECLERVGLFDERLPSSQDYDLWIRISSEFQFACINKPLLIYHVHDMRISTNVEALDRGLLLMIDKNGIEYFTLRPTPWYYISLEIGTLWCLQHKLSKARKSYIRSVKLYPLGIRAYVGLALSLCGVKVFKKVRRMSNWWNSVDWTSMKNKNESRVVKKPTLQLIQKLSKALDLAEIRYCHWKSNESLHRSLCGDNDLDLLVDPEQRFQFSKVLIRLGFKQTSKPQDARYPGIFNFYGYDSESRKMVHVHVHYRLIVGCDLIKNYELPFVLPYLDTARDANGLRVPAVEFEYIVFVIRMVLKRRLLAWALGHPDPRILIQAFTRRGRPLLRGSEGREWHDFQFRVKREKISDLLAKNLPAVDRKLFELCERSLQPTEQRWGWLRAGAALCSALKPYQRYSTPFAVALGFFRRAETLITALSRYLPFRNCPPQKRRLAADGRVIAFVGGDGSGKSTNIKALKDWLEQRFDVQTLHLGLPPLDLVRFLHLLSSKAFRLLMGSPPETQVRPLYAITQALVARGRWKLAKAALSAARNGTIVLCDRFPLMELKLSEGSVIPSINNDGSPVISWLGSIEQSYYDRIVSLGLPHDIIVLRVDPQIAIDRKPEENPDFILPRHQEVWNVDWKVVENSKVIDAAQPLESVLDEVRCVVWNLLPSWSPHIEVVGHAGSGKTTLVTALLERDMSISGRVMPAVHPLRLLRNGVALWWTLFSIPFIEWKWMTISKAQLELWEQRRISPNSHLPILYDQGPFFFNAFALWMHSGRPQSRRFRVWHQRMIDRSRDILDLIIWLQADNLVLRERINSRPAYHIIKGKSDLVQNQFLADYDQYFNHVLTNQSGHKSFSCVEFRVDDIPPSRLVDKIIETIF